MSCRPTLASFGVKPLLADCSGLQVRVVSDVIVKSYYDRERFAGCWHGNISYVVVRHPYSIFHYIGLLPELLLQTWSNKDRGRFIISPSQRGVEPFHSGFQILQALLFVTECGTRRKTEHNNYNKHSAQQFVPAIRDDSTRLSFVILLHQLPSPFCTTITSIKPEQSFYYKNYSRNYPHPTDFLTGKGRGTIRLPVLVWRFIIYLKSPFDGKS